MREPCNCGETFEHNVKCVLSWEECTLIDKARVQGEVQSAIYEKCLAHGERILAIDEIWDCGRDQWVGTWIVRTIHQAGSA